MGGPHNEGVVLGFSSGVPHNGGFGISRSDGSNGLYLALCPGFHRCLIGSYTVLRIMWSVFYSSFC